MADSYVDGVMHEILSPTWWDAGEGVYRTIEEGFKEFGELAGKAQEKALTLADAEKVNRFAQFLAKCTSALAIRVVAIDVPALTPEDQKLKAFIANLAQQAQKVAQQAAFTVDEVAAGQASAPKALERLVATMGPLLTLGGWTIGLVHVGVSYAHGGTEESQKIAASVLAGMLAAKAGAAAGALTGFVTTELLGLAGVAVSATLAASVGAVLGAAAAGYFATKSTEALWGPYLHPLLDHMFDVGGELASQANTAYTDALAKLGKFDGTWLEGLDATADQKAALTIVLAGASSLPISEQMNNDIKRLFAAPFDGSGLVSRDALLKAVMLIAQEQHAYISERVTVDAGVVALSLPPGGAQALASLRDLAFKSLTPFDQAGFALTGADRVVVSPTGGTLAGSAKNDLMIGGDGVDGLIGGAGNDELLGGAADDTLLGEAGTDVLFGGTGNDFLDGGTGPDYLYGGAGTDTYNFAGSFGGDWIVDSDGLGKIQADGVVLAGGAQITPGLYHDPVTGWFYSLNNGDLVIRKDGSVNQITVRNWTPGQLGITLTGPVAIAPLPVDEVHVLDDDPRPEVGGFIDVSRRHPGFSYQIIGTPDADTILTGDGKDEIIAGGGADLLYSADGDDRLYGGDKLTLDDAIALAESDRTAPDGKADLLEAGTGDDLLIGGIDHNILMGGAGKDTMVGGTGVDFAMGDGFNFAYGAPLNYVLDRSTSGKVVFYVVDSFGKQWSFASETDINGDDDVIYTGHGDDIANGELGDDFLSLGAGDDIGIGWAGNDTVDGGAGNDSLFGDFNWDPSAPGPEVTEAMLPSFHGLDAALHGNDVLDGGDGNDEIWGNGGDDELYGGAGNDELRGDDFITPGEFHGNDYLDGGDGDDELVGGGKADELFGGAGNDTLWGDVIPTTSGVWGPLDISLQGDDYLDGEDGNDNLNGGGGDDTLVGGAGQDTLFGDGDTSYLPGADHGNDYLDGGDGDDVLLGQGGDDSLFGGAGNDVLLGDDAPENLAGQFHGDDYLDGEEGDDSLLGGGGNDTLIGGAGNDTLTGDLDPLALGSMYHGDDVLYGDEGDDYLQGGGGADTLSGGDGNDSMHGDWNGPGLLASADGDDVLYGEAGNDILVGGGGADMLYGGEGNDSLRGDDAVDHLDAARHGNDTLDGGSGDDALWGDGGDDILDGGDGNDYLAGEDESSAIEVSSLTGNDTLSGGSGSDSLIGGNGNDFLYGDDGDDFLFGGNGDDVLEGGTGTDVLSGGAGNDTYIFARGEGSLNAAGASEGVHDAEGTNSFVFEQIDTAELQVRGDAAGNLVVDYSPDDRVVLVDFVNAPDTAFRINGGSALALTEFVGTYATAPIAVLDQQSHQHFLGGRQNDSITVTSRYATVSGGLGNDTLRGSGGNDTYLINAGEGADVIVETSARVIAGTAATNQVVFGKGINAADVTLAASGQDLVVSFQGSSDQLRVQGFYANFGIDRFVFNDGTSWDQATILARVPLVLTEGPDNFFGTAGNDVINALGGNDTVYGNAGDDLIDGGAGNDVLYGGDGQDTLIGGDGQDYLNDLSGDNRMLGGAGNDSLQGGSGNDYLDGGTGVDTLIGGDGDNTLVDGELVAGGGGNDTYVYTTINGLVYVADTGGAHDVLVLPSYASAATVRLDLQPYQYELGYDDVMLSVSGSGASGTLDLTRFFGNPIARGQIEEIQFSDGTVWTLAQVLGQLPINRLSDANDHATAFSTNDTIFALGGDDYINSSAGDDVVDGGTGNDTLYSGDGNDSVEGGDGQDMLSGGSGNDRLSGSAGNDSIAGDDGADTISGGTGDDTLHGDTDSFFASSTDGADILDGGEGNDSLYGDGGADTLIGGAGRDFLRGGDGDDVYRIGRTSGHDVISDAGNGVDSVVFDNDVGVGDVALFRDGLDLLIAIGHAAAHVRVANQYGTGYPIERLVFADGTVWDAAQIAARTVVGTPNAMLGTAGNDTFVVDDVNDTITEAVGGGIDTVLASVSYTLPTNVENLTLTGWADLNATGNAVANVLTGNDGDNTLTDVGGSDTLIGGRGDDTYYVGGATTVVEAGGEGVDLIVTPGTFTLPDNVENLSVGSITSIFVATLRGNSLDNVITASSTSLNTTLDGGAGADTMIALSGGIFYVDNPGDRIISASAQVFSSIDWTLAPGDTALTLIGNAAVSATGNSRGNLLDGSQNSAANELRGGAGDDTYHVGIGDRVVEAAGEGDDTVEIEFRPAGDTFRTDLFATASIEHFVVGVGLGSGLTVVGSDRSEDITVATDQYSYLRFENDTLLGFGGNDTLRGGSGSYRLEGGDGNDLLMGGDSSGSARDTLVGGEGDDTLQGAYGYGDVLEGGTGADVLEGRGDHDVYLFARGDGRDTIVAASGFVVAVDNAVRFAAGIATSDVAVSQVGDDLHLDLPGGSDQIVVRSFFLSNNPSNLRNPIQRIEFADGTSWGLGTIRALANPGLTNHSPVVAVPIPDLTLTEGTQVRFTVPAGSFVDPDAGDALSYRATLADGSALPSWLTFDPATTTFNGNANPGTFSLKVTATDYAGLSVSDVFDLIVSAPPRTIVGTEGRDGLYGGSGNDTLSGLGGDDTLDGGAGADSMIGGTGNDTYYVDNPGDVIVENAGEGSDLVNASISYVLGANLENVALLGTGNIDATGNELANTLQGTTGDNRLDGGAGADTMFGHGGHDTFVVDNVGDVLGGNIATADNIETVEASVSWTLQLNFENLTLTGTGAINGTGNSIANVIIGNAAANRIDGGLGVDTMVGGDGDDTYVVDGGVGGDVIVELAGGGFDAVESAGSFTLPTEVEKLTLTGSNFVNGTGNASSNLLIGNSNNNVLDGGAGADTMTGGGGSDSYIVDNTGDIVIELAGGGTDSVHSSVSYTLPSEVENLVFDGSADIAGTGNSLANSIFGNAGANRIDGGAGADTLQGAGGDDTYVVDNAADVVREAAGAGYDAVEASLSWTLGNDIEKLTLTGGANIDATGNATNNVLIGNSGANRLSGNAGADTLSGGDGDDTLDGGAGNDVLDGGEGSDTFLFGLNSGTDTIVSAATVAAKNDTLLIGAGLTTNDLVLRRVGDDLRVEVAYSQDSVVVRNHFAGNSASGSQIDTIRFADGTTWNVAAIAALSGNHAPTVGPALTSKSLAKGDTFNYALPVAALVDRDHDVLDYAATLADGTPLPAWLSFDPAGLTFSGNTASAPLGNLAIKVTGTDPGGLSATTSFNLYVQTSAAGRVVFGTAGDDTISAFTNDTIHAGAGNDYLYGGSGDDVIFGEGGNDTMWAQGGHDTLVGGVGDDSYYVDDTDQIIQENFNEGVDFVQSRADYTLSANVENLRLMMGASRGTGNALDNLIEAYPDFTYGITYGVILDGGAGADTMRGSLGDDVYIVDNPLDVVSEYSNISGRDNTGIDTVRSSVTYTLPFGTGFTVVTGVENLVLTGSAAISGTGNQLDNVLTGNAASNTLSGSAGNDTLDGGQGDDILDGGAGDDTYLFGRGYGADTITGVDTTSGKVDTVQFGAGIAVADVAVARDGDDLVLTIKGSADSLRVKNHFVGNSGSGSQVDRVAFADGTVWNVATLLGLVGTNHAPVVSVPLPDQFVAKGDAYSFTIPGGTFSDPDAGDTLSYSALAADGSALPAWLTFNAATRTLTASTVAATAGTTSIRIVGTDAGGLSASDVFDLTIDGYVINGTPGDDVLTAGSSNDTIHGGAGNDLLVGGVGNNALLGEEGNDTMSGGGGLDTLIGGTGDDRYDLASVGDVIVEQAGEGIDLVRSAFGYALGANLENLTLTGSGAVNATGNALANVLTGNAAANVLDGQAGADTLIGGAGDDTYVVDNVGDQIVELAGEGVDSELASVSATLSANVESLTLTGAGAIDGTGNALANVITGNSVANVLDGQAGADTMSGGAGDDTYVVDNAGDLVVEAASSGTDLVRASIGYALGANVENLTLVGSAAINGTGNALANTITGNDGDNRIDGGASADSMAGGLGNDSYVVDNSADVVSELAGAGIDTVESSVNWTLGANVENLTLTGSAVSATGNALANMLTGDGAANMLDGQAGADTMAGGAGDDTYVVDDVGDVVSEASGAGNDLVRASVSYSLGADVENLTLTGGAALNASGNALANVITGNSGANRIDGGAGADTMAGGAGDDTYVVDSVGDVVTETAGNGIDTIESALTLTLGNELENLTLTGTGTIDGHGNALANVLRGNAAANVLDGGLGADSLFGGAGNDTYLVDNVGDVVGESAGEGIDLVQSSVSFSLGANVENLTLVGSAVIDATGNALANTLVGNGAANVLDGGAGDDLLDGGAGNDTYLFGRGSGNDVIASFDTGAGKIDTLQLGAGIAVADVILTRDVDDLVVTISGSSESIRIRSQFVSSSASGNQIDRISFADGVTWDAATIEGFFGANHAPVLATALADQAVVQGAELNFVIPAGSFVDPDAGDVLSYAATLADGSALPSWIDFDPVSRTFSGSTAELNVGASAVRVTVTDSGNLSASDIFNLSIVAATSGAIVYGTPGNDVLVTGSGNDTIFAGAGDDSVRGGAGDNVLNGEDGNDTLDGAGGRDTMTGGQGDDVYSVDNVGDQVIEIAGAGQGTDAVLASISYTLAANVENLTLTGTANIDATGNALANIITGNDGDNVLSGGTGSDIFAGGRGDDTYIVDSSDDLVTEAAGEGVDTVLSSIAWSLGANLENLTLTGTASVSATGNELANVLTGNSGNNRLNGGVGADQMIGGAGNDTYVVDDVRDVIVELAAGGSDAVEASVSYTLSAEIEKITLTGSADIDATGNASSNTLIGNAGANRLDGGAGNDAMTGGAGDDTYVVDSSGDKAVEVAGGGTDTVLSSVTWTLGAELENLVLTGSANIKGTGNALDNVLTGNAGDNVLTGGLGNDTLLGGQGNDTYVVADVGDVVVEAAGEGIDKVQVAFSYVLGANLENLTLTGSAEINGTGNALANVITGNSGDNVLDGGAGADTLIGGAGDDHYFVDDAGDVIKESSTGGFDSVDASVSYVLSANVETLTLTGGAAIDGAGNTLANTLTGNNAANRLDGGRGADTMSGGLGDDTYVVDNVGDVVTENADGGIDTVLSSITWTLGAELENLTLTGTANVNGTGNTLDNVLVGNAGNNILAGAGGVDTLAGGLGNDIYVIADSSAVVEESAGEGLDLVRASVSYTLTDNVENLTLTDVESIDGTGNDLDNVITGNAGANRLDGGAGADRLVGGAGDDVYIVENVGDLVVETASAGNDRVESSISYVLGANLEMLTLIGSADIDGTGNTLANNLVGNAGANRLDGGSGADQMAGGDGDDTYIVDNIGDSASESAGGGIDAVLSSVTWTLGANFENLTLTGTGSTSAFGNELANLLVGNAGNNRIDGGAGDDAMSGGAGNDTYVVDSVGDTVTELAAAGTDTIESSISWTLGDNVENLTLTGLAAVEGTGNDLNNVLTGNAGDNVLDGGGGSDRMAGGFGNDTYIVDVGGDVVTEAVDAGIDTVRTGLGYRLGSNVENLVLTGSAAVNGTGNALDNVLVGNGAANVLAGNAGNDRLDGGGGGDTLKGGTGNDSYVMGRGYGNELVLENDATAGNSDSLDFMAGISADQVWFRHVGNNLEVSLIGTDDKAVLQNWYLGSQYHVEQFHTSDGQTLLDSKVQDLVNAMASFAPPGIGQTTLPPSYQSALLPIIAADWGP